MTNKQNPTDDTKYEYGLTHRPPMIATVPDGFHVVTDRTVTYRWGIISYEQELNREEVLRYELHPASLNTRRFPVDTHVNWRGHHCYISKLFAFRSMIEIRLVNGPDGFANEICEWDADLTAWGHHD